VPGICRESATPDCLAKGGANPDVHPAERRPMPIADAITFDFFDTARHLSRQ
jgi:hypothetical protein